MRRSSPIDPTLVLFACATLAALSAGGCAHPASGSASASSGVSDVSPGFDGFDGTEDDEGSGGGPSAAPLDTTSVVLAAKPPPPLSGGTLLVTADGTTAVAADPDRDTVWWTAVGSAPGALKSVALHPGDEPGRVVEDGAGLVHVVLRGAGAVATLDIDAGTVVRRTPVCAAPRGIAYDATANAVIVACVGGELVTLAAADDSVMRSLVLDADLRDPVLLGGGFLAVSKLRNAEVLVVDPTGAVASRTRPFVAANTEPTSAWRMVAGPAPGSVILAHQLATTQQVDDVNPGGYGSVQTQGVVTGAVTILTFDPTKPTRALALEPTAFVGGLLVDVALDESGDVVVVDYSDRQVLMATTPTGTPTATATLGVTSAAIGAAGQLVTFAREPSAFAVAGALGTYAVPLEAPSVVDTGHDLFHFAAQPGGGLACASCHPEGRDDGRVWSFASSGLRRTPSLVGGLLATAPFHWDGSLADIDAVMTVVFTNRMGGDVEDSAHAAAVARFLDAIPRVPLAVATPSTELAHGQALFESAALGCTSCHAGAHLTNNATVEVGTGQAFQVPTLIGVGLRAPYLHNGCAATLAARFDASCGGGDRHGHTSQLSSSDVADLVSYLETL